MSFEEIAKRSQAIYSQIAGAFSHLKAVEKVEEIINDGALALQYADYSFLINAQSDDALQTVHFSTFLKSAVGDEEILPVHMHYEDGYVSFDNTTNIKNARMNFHHAGIAYKNELINYINRHLLVN